MHKKPTINDYSIVKGPLTNVILDLTSISYTLKNTHTMLSHGHDLGRVSSTSTTLPSSSSSNTTRTMEEVWKDINLSTTNNHHKTYRGFILQDFLAKPFSSNNDTPTSVSSSPPRPPPPPPPPVLLNLNSGPEQLNFVTEDPTTPNVDQVLGSADSCSVLLGHGIGGMRILPVTERAGGDRRHNRMIKNRESAARSRARKQAYTNELENEVERLKEENAKLKRKHQLQSATTQMTKKGGLQRTSTVPF
ncbi:hypothetical protein L1987_52283 [Smallanthus sonchifolius]|uniref:Uncharacterized protein n=1 Tax=Smallanthus sonchifolius TaxID=185202 RepID=A0ACB9ETU7_9ASTR|nr:hypothetical protein L1987_52283 [Smallanthus sonchifolius]